MRRVMCYEKKVCVGYGGFSCVLLLGLCFPIKV